MKALVQMLEQRAGLTEEQAIKSVETVKEFIQSKLPPMMHGLVDNFMGSLDEEDEDFMEAGNNDWDDIAQNVSNEATDKLEETDERKDTQAGQ